MYNELIQLVRSDNRISEYDIPKALKSTGLENELYTNEDIQKVIDMTRNAIVLYDCDRVGEVLNYMIKNSKSREIIIKTNNLHINHLGSSIENKKIIITDCLFGDFAGSDSKGLEMIFEGKINSKFIGKGADSSRFVFKKDNDSRDLAYESKNTQVIIEGVNKFGCGEKSTNIRITFEGANEGGYVANESTNPVLVFREKSYGDFICSRSENPIVFFNKSFSGRFLCDKAESARVIINGKCHKDGAFDNSKDMILLLNNLRIKNFLSNFFDKYSNNKVYFLATEEKCIPENFKQIKIKETKELFDIIESNNPSNFEVLKEKYLKNKVVLELIDDLKNKVEKIPLNKENLHLML